MSDFYDQYRCPFGKEGKIIANRMNRNHRSMTVWTLKNVQIKKDDKILDVGCGAGRISRYHCDTFIGNWIKKGGNLLYRQFWKYHPFIGLNVSSQG